MTVFQPTIDKIILIWNFTCHTSLLSGKLKPAKSMVLAIHFKNVSRLMIYPNENFLAFQSITDMSMVYTPKASFQVKRMQVNVSIMKIWNIRQNNTTKCNYRRTDEHEDRRWTRWHSIIWYTYRPTGRHVYTDWWAHTHIHRVV